MANRSRNLLLMVVGIGALGGVASLLFAVATGEPIASPLYCISVVLLAAGAAPIGVYVISNSDRRDLTRCLILAFLCGFAWRPVYEGGTVYIKTLSQQSDALKHAVSTRAAAGDFMRVTRDQPERSDERVEALTTSAVEAVKNLPDASPPAAKAQVSQATNEAVAAIQSISNARPSVASHALTTIGVSAAEKGDTLTARRALRALDALESQAGALPQPTRTVLLQNRAALAWALAKRAGTPR